MCKTLNKNLLISITVIGMFRYVATNLLLISSTEINMFKCIINDNII